MSAGCHRDAGRIGAEPRICWRTISEEVTDMPQVLSFIGWLLRQAYLYWLAPPEESLRGAELELEVEAPGMATGADADSSISSVGKTHRAVSTVTAETHIHTHFLLSVLGPTHLPHRQPPLVCSHATC